MKTIRKTASFRTKEGKVQFAAALTKEEWSAFAAKARAFGQSITGRMGYLIRADLKTP